MCFCYSKFPWKDFPLTFMTSGETLNAKSQSTLHSPCCPSCSAALGASATLLPGLGSYKPGSCPWDLKHAGQIIVPGSQRLLQPFHGWMADIDCMNSKDILEKMWHYKSRSSLLQYLHLYANDGIKSSSGSRKES